MIVLNTVLIYVTDKIVAQFIKEEGYSRLKKVLCPPIKFKHRLRQIIKETVLEFEARYPIESVGDTFPFYYSEVLFSQLNEHILFHTDKPFKIDEFKEFDRIIAPTEEQLQLFYSIFISKIKADVKLKKLKVEEFYKEEIFKISDVLSGLLSDVKSIKSFTDRNTLTIDVVLKRLNEQVNAQLQKQERTGKYLPGTFIENSEAKECTRCFLHPILFAQKELEYLAKLNFDRANEIRNNDGFDRVDFDVSSVYSGRIPESIVENNVLIHNLREYVSAKANEFSRIKTRSYQYDYYGKQLEKVFKQLQYLVKKTLLIHEAAGQGKTNFVCDLAKNFLLKHEIPCVFLTGYDINAENITESIFKRIFPLGTSDKFDEMLDILEMDICKNKPFIIIIDGLNENTTPKKFSANLEILIKALESKPFVRVLLTCRTEYLEANYKNIINSIFSDSVTTIDRLTLNYHDQLGGRLLKAYFQYFNINVKLLDERVERKLSSNYLLLRIFSEVYTNNNHLVITNLYKEELFDKYLQKKIQEITSKEDAAYAQYYSIDIVSFLKKIVEYMIQNDTYMNIPLSSLIDDGSKDTFIRFLDENIIIKRDLDEKTIFANNEVVNFTYDEFRDYSIIKYLLECYQQDEIKKFIDKSFNEESQILEGGGRFLFYFSRKQEDLASVYNHMKSKSWFHRTFVDCFFDLEDKDVNDDEIAYLKEIMFSSRSICDKVSKSIVYSRWDTKVYTKLNIGYFDGLFDNISEDDYQLLLGCFDRYNNSIDKFIEQLDHVLANKLDKNEEYHNLFKFIIYLLPLNMDYSIKLLLSKYHRQNKEKATAYLKEALNKDCELLNISILKFTEEYDIQL